MQRSNNGPGKAVPGFARCVAALVRVRVSRVSLSCRFNLRASSKWPRHESFCTKGAVRNVAHTFAARFAERS
jgi:hypothetical protein